MMNFPIDQLPEVLDTPSFVYSRRMLRERAQQALACQVPFGLTVRYAVKANSHPEIIRLFDELGLQFDASSSYEAVLLLERGVSGPTISLSSQQPAHNLNELLQAGVRYVATSLHQLELFAASPYRPGTVGLRLNPGMGSGHNNRTMTGGVNSSFGLWHAYIEQALELVRRHDITIDRLHIHIGSGADPRLWGEAMDAALALVGRLPEVTTLDIGGGFKVYRFGDEQEADLAAICEVFSRKLAQFSEETGRQLHLEIEPGTWLVAHAGVLVAEVVDIVDTGADGHTFLRLDTGMNDITRPGMYGAQHEMMVLSGREEQREYIVVGHCCETGDILTPAPSNPENLESRRLTQAEIGDKLVIFDAGAYCQSMSLKRYNAYPDAGAYFID